MLSQAGITEDVVSGPRAVASWREQQGGNAAAAFTAWARAAAAEGFTALREEENLQVLSTAEGLVGEGKSAEALRLLRPLMRRLCGPYIRFGFNREEKMYGFWIDTEAVEEDIREEVLPVLREEHAEEEEEDIPYGVFLVERTVLGRKARALGVRSSRSEILFLWKYTS